MSLFAEIEHLHSLMTRSELPETSAGSIWNSVDFDRTLFFFFLVNATAE